MNEIILENGKKIGGTNSPFIIAEIGNNHNGDIEIAKKLIEIASQIGVDAVKFQVKDIESSFSKELLEKPYNGPNSFGKTYREHKEFLEFNNTFDFVRLLYEIHNSDKSKKFQNIAISGKSSVLFNHTWKKRVDDLFLLISKLEVIKKSDS